MRIEWQLMRKLQLFIPILGFISLTGLLWKGLYLDPKELPSMLISKLVPEFSLPSLTGERGLNNSRLPDNIYLLNVWGSYCLPCLAEHPTLMRLAEENEIPIVGLNYKDRPNLAINWLDDNGNPFEFTLVDLDGRFGIELGVYGAPETFLVDKEGRIRYRHVSILDEQVWEEIFVPFITQIKEEGSNI